MSWEYRIALLASGEYPWVPCTEHEGLDIQRLGYVTLDSGIRMPAEARDLSAIDGEDLA